MIIFFKKTLKKLNMEIVKEEIPQCLEFILNHFN